MLLQSGAGRNCEKTKKRGTLRSTTRTRNFLFHHLDRPLAKLALVGLAAGSIARANSASTQRCQIDHAVSQNRMAAAGEMLIAILSHAGG